MDHVSSLAARAASRLPGTVDNPFDHTTPSLEVFGVDFSNKLYALLGGLWGIGFLYLAAMLVMAIMKFASAKKARHDPDVMSNAAADAKLVAVALVGMSAIGTIFVALVNLFN